MEHGRNNDDEQKPEDRLALHVVLYEEGVVGEDEQEEGAQEEVVPVEAGRPRALRPPHAALDVRAEQVPEERAGGEDEDRDEAARDGAPRKVRLHPQRDAPLQEPDGGARERAAEEPAPRLPVPEQAVSVREDPAPVDRPPAAPQDRRGVRRVRGEEEPERLEQREPERHRRSEGRGRQKRIGYRGR